MIKEPKKRFNTVRHLVHTTKKRIKARFDFDTISKMPSYLRRAAIACTGKLYLHADEAGTVEKETDQKDDGESIAKLCGNRAMPIFYP